MQDNSTIEFACLVTRICGLRTREHRASCGFDNEAPDARVLLLQKLRYSTKRTAAANKIAEEIDTACKKQSQ